MALHIGKGYCSTSFYDHCLTAREDQQAGYKLNYGDPERSVTNKLKVVLHIALTELEAGDLELIKHKQSQ